MAYATVQDLRDVNSFSVGNAQVLLDRASRDVDWAIQSAIYATDDDGLPTDSRIATALRDATVEQVAYNLEIGNANGIAHGLQAGVPSGASAGGVDLSRGPSAGGATVDQPRIGSQVQWILRQAGLCGQAPQTYTWGRYL